MSKQEAEFVVVKLEFNVIVTKVSLSLVSVQEFEFAYSPETIFIHSFLKVKWQCVFIVQISP